MFSGWVLSAARTPFQYDFRNLNGLLTVFIFVLFLNQRSAFARISQLLCKAGVESPSVLFQKWMDAPTSHTGDLRLFQPAGLVGALVELLLLHTHTVYMYTIYS